jgi:hypothetical protein
MSRLQAIQSGTNLAAQAAQTANVINPISRQATVRDQFLTGPQALEFQQRQNLLEQQSRQTQFNLEASPDPLAQGLLGLEMQRLNLRSSGQLAASQIESANALATAQQQQQSLAGLTGSLQSLVQTYNQPKQEFQSKTPGGYGFNFNFLQ